MTRAINKKSNLFDSSDCCFGLNNGTNDWNYSIGVDLIVKSSRLMKKSGDEFLVKKCKIR